MNEDYMDKLMDDIQRYLREESRKRPAKRSGSPAPVESSAKRTLLPRPTLVGLLTLLSACAVGSITVAILLLGFLGSSAHDASTTIWLLAVGGCGIFFTSTMVSAWKRLVLLSQIEENTREILESKLETNALLDHLMRNMT